jgi:hypothetical protein
MNTFLPLAIIVGLGALAGLVCHRRSARFWAASLVAAGIAAILWGLGVYLLLWLTAPNELGPPLLGPVLFTFLTALVPAALVGWLMPYCSSGWAGQRPNPSNTRC